MWEEWTRTILTVWKFARNSHMNHTPFDAVYDGFGNGLSGKLMPAFHYNITNNYRYHIQEGIRGSDEVIRTTVKPTKWFFTFNGGLAFRF